MFLLTVGFLADGDKGASSSSSFTLSGSSAGFGGSGGQFLGSVGSRSSLQSTQTQTLSLPLGQAHQQAAAVALAVLEKALEALQVPADERPTAILAVIAEAKSRPAHVQHAKPIVIKNANTKNVVFIFALFFLIYFIISINTLFFLSPLFIVRTKLK